MMEPVVGAEAYSLSNSQMNIWNLEQTLTGTSVNNICETVRIRGTFDIPALQQCLNFIIRTDPTLRTQIFLSEHHVPMQRETAFAPQTFPVFDFSSTNEEGLHSWEDSVTRQVMPVTDAPLYRFYILKISEHEGGILVKTHHLISDGWSQVALINRIAKIYLSLLNGKPLPASPEPLPSYRLHVEEEQKYLASKACGRDRIFWEETLSEAFQDSETLQPVSVKDCRNAQISPVGQRVTFYLSETLNHALSAFCTSRRVAPFAVFYMALAIYLKRIKNADKMCIGSPVHNRSSITDRQTTGMFVSTLPFCCEIDENNTFEELNGSLADHWLDLLRHQRIPFTEISHIAKQLNPAADRLFSLVLSFHNSQAFRSRDTFVSFSGQWHYAGYQAEQLCIHLNNIEDEHRYSVNYDYLTQLFTKNEIEELHRYLVRILTQALEEPEKPICQLAVIGEDEREKVLFSFNKTENYFGEETVAGMLEQGCGEYPSRAAVISDGQRYSYGELWKISGSIAAQLHKITGGKKGIAAVLLDKSPALLFSMAAAARSGCAWVILPPSLPRQRMLEILEGSGADVLLSTGELIAKCDLALPSVAVDRLPEDPAEPPRCSSEPSDLAYLVYTSGSTGKPKGVEIEQHSLLNFAKGMSPLYEKGAVLSLCNIGFDAFLLESIVSLLNGRTVVLPTDGEQENPSRIAALIRSYAVGFLATTPSRLTAYLKNADFYDAAEKLEVILCGGEAFPGSLLKTLFRCTGAKIYNQYGPSETTVGVSVGLLNDAAHITAGKPMPNCRCYVLDSHLNPLPVGAYGELFIAGDCVGRGYHGAPELTQAVFLDNPFEPDERMYRTGDIAAWTADGELLLKGRKDGQIKLRGQRIEPDEIASRLMMHPAVRQAAVRTVHTGGGELLAAYYTADRELPEAELLTFSATYLPDYMVPSAFQYVPELPLTANGKIDDRRLPPLRTSVQTRDDAPDAKTETILSVFRSTLKYPEMTSSDDYFQCGGDSLNALEVLTRLEAAFGTRLRVADLYACRTAARLSPLLPDEANESAAVQEIPKAPELEEYPLTPAQLGIYFETAKMPDGTAYNMPCGFETTEKIDTARLQRAMERLLAAEPVLRTGFYPSKSGICQKILPSVAAEPEIFRTRTLEEAEDLFVRPFDLSQPPLLRVGVWENDGRCVVMTDLHHLVGDAVTASQILVRLNEYYCGREPVSPPVAFHDYAYWLRRNQEQLASDQLGYWREQMRSLPPLPEIPTDFPRLRQFDYRGADEESVLNEQDSLACDEYCRRTGLTAYQFFTGAFGIFLSKLTGSEELLVGTPVSCRRFPAIYDTFGLFVNTLPLRLAPHRQTVLADYYRTVKEQVAGLLDHADVSLDELVRLAGEKSGQDPLYRTLISVRPIDTDSFLFDGKPVRPVLIPAKSAKLDLNLEVYRQQGCYHFRFQYAASLFAAETAALYTRSFAQIVRESVRDDSAAIADCDPVSVRDRYFLFDRPRAQQLSFSSVPIDLQIDEMAQRMPDAPALVFHDQITTLGDMKTRSDALAASLMEKGIRTGDAVGILCRRGPELLIAMLGVLKAGGTYVPMLPSFPENRLKSMMEISGVVLTLCDSSTFQTQPAELLRGAAEIEFLSQPENAVRYRRPAGQNEICCILFTSGSTGQPKGVMIRHRSLCNLMAVLFPALSSADGGYLCTANSIFDIFITETLIAMAFGRTSVMADEEEMVLPWRAARLIREYGVRLIEFTPSRAQLFFGNDDFVKAIHAMPVAMMCGEVLPPQLLEKLRAAGCGRIYNLYGPTETTVYSTMADVTAADRITVGPMFPNCRGYVLDEEMRPVMPTAAGELYFGGECLAAGYVGREDLTKKSFLPDPFYPGETVYRSGDMVRLLPDGRIDFIGRRDHQVKLNGQRIELAEINQKMLDSGLAARAAAIVKKENGYMVLRAFVQPADPSGIDLAALRRYLEKELPGYMVPSEFHVLDSLPCTASGKLDFKALEALEPQKSAAPAVSSQPREPASPVSAVQAPAQPAAPPDPVPAPPSDPGQVLRSVWEEILPGSADAPDVSFFEQGGNSLSALNLLSACYSHGLSMSLSEFYEHPTLNDQLQYFHIQPEPLPVQNAVSPDPDVPSAQPAAPAGNALHHETVSADLLTEIWQETLSNDRIDPDRSFFEQGGNSLAALNLLSAYYSHGISLSLAEFYEHPTLRDQIKQFADSDALPVSAPQPSAGKKAVLLTGATGFFGAHLVRELLDAGYPTVYCLTRGGDPERLYGNLEWYFGKDWVSSNRSRLRPVAGDIMQESFGIAPDELSEIAAQTGFLLHAAADVRHYACDDSAERTNAVGTANAAVLAAACGAKLIHISTVSLSGEYLTGHPEEMREFCEDDFEIGQNWQDGVYLRGKYRAEQAVRRAREEGLNTLILRIGRLVGRSSDGVFQKNPHTNTFWELVDGMSCLDKISTDLLQLPMELTAVDLCAKAAVLLMTESGPVYHIFNPDLLSVAEIMHSLQLPVHEAGREEFESYLQEQMRSDNRLRLAPLLSQYIRLTQVPFRIRPVCTRTREILSHKGFLWERPDPSVLLRSFLKK